MTEPTARVAVLMGSGSDADIVEKCTNVLRDLGIPHEVRVLSAHRTPEETAAYISGAKDRGIRVVVAAAGMAAHLAGACAAHSFLPVIGIPIASGPLEGRDALLSTVMMPPGIPVATVGINGAANAGHLAAQILALQDEALAARIVTNRESMREKVFDQDRDIGGR